MLGVPTTSLTCPLANDVDICKPWQAFSSNKAGGHGGTRALLLVARRLEATSNKGIATKRKAAIRGSWPY